MERSPSITFTNLNRIFYPEQDLTKQDLVNYYDWAADLILPHIKNRPLTLLRCPRGNQQKCFYQKHFNNTVPNVVKSVNVLEHGRAESYIYINNFDGLMGLVQMGVLEIHPWGSNIKAVEKPDRVTFDLDPGPNVAWKKVIDCAKLIHQFLDFLGLRSFVKTTGGKGLHVMFPIKPTLYWDELRDITKRIVDLIVEVNPSEFIGTMSKTKREGKIFIDYLRNARGATAVAAYSTRAKPNAPISVPLSWEELTPKIKADSFNIQNIRKKLKNLKEDPWEDFFKIKQSFNIRIKKQLGFKA